MRGPEERERVFTAYVRRLAAPGGAEDAALFDRLWSTLRGALRAEVRKRRLWDAPPVFLGVHGWESWESGETRGGARHDALEDLLADCYTFVFVDRRRALQAQLAIKDNVDGLVFVNIRHFLHERQREHDPLGYRVFEAVHRAVEAAVAAGELLVVAGDTRLRNDTRLAWEAGGTDEPTRDLRTLVAPWSDDLLPDLVTARGRQLDEVAERLRGRFAELRQAGVSSFLLREILDPLKVVVRERWAALLSEGPGEAVSWPDLRAEGEEAFRRLVACVQGALDQLEAAATTRGYLATLWQFLRLWAAEPEGARDAVAVGAPRAAADDEPPSHRRLAEELKIPRERLPGLLGTLGRLVERCQSAIGRKASVTTLRESSEPQSLEGGAV
jgi:hypothetical protein